MLNKDEHNVNKAKPDSLFDRCVESYCTAASSPGTDPSDMEDVVCDFLASYAYLCVAGGLVNFTWRTPNTCRTLC